MKKIIMILGVLGSLFSSCEKEETDLHNNVSGSTEEHTQSSNNENLEIEDFIYKGMNEIYLYKAEVPELADDYFSTEDQKYSYLENFSSPEELFNTLTYSEDRFSFITDDYESLENRFQGISGSTGMKYGLGRIEGTNNVFGFLQYILPGTSAEEAGLKRGTVFTEVNGQKLTISNYQRLLDDDSFSINIGRIVDGSLQMTDQTVTLTDDPYTSNPVYIAKTLNIENQKIGYLMYNSFIGDFDDELNTAFGKFKADGISELILDLRYNGGGSVESAVDLASMITGQYEGEVFMKEQWNKKYQEHFESTDPERLINRFDSKIRTGAAINHLNLNKVYILTSNTTASASELVINGLAPYIDVVQVGETTTGKFQASVTLYDSPDFSKKNINDKHTYAIQPLVFKSINAHGKSDYTNGLAPDIQYRENLGNLGTLGEPTEPLLQIAINDIFGRAQVKQDESAYKTARKYRKIGESGMNEPDFQRMYIEEIPPILNRNQ
ncbi:S41 family peptidase [Gramella jeungdoensis]|uniref:S41 family peptidase n=1 Tax=Gramella jeungdoensis TaxID=708091 RepID=A0ABT0Z6L6_9FLAO|nr:S41 family peptidase [Gramella jeungdoensis]MCM8571060.1 S41 family peptidase [Gramella jeungdoensis]